MLVDEIPIVCYRLESSFSLKSKSHLSLELDVSVESRVVVFTNISYVDNLISHAEALTEHQRCVVVVW